MDQPSPNIKWLERPLLPSRLSGEVLLFGVITLLAIITRFSDLGTRPLSHDESIHIYYSYLFSEGQGYAHNPLSHGPLQFHVIAALFKLFGSNDLVGRIPHALAFIASIMFLWKWRKYFGSAGVLITASLMVVSPIMLFYSRYARNESFIVLFGLVNLYAILRFLETKKDRYLYLISLAFAFHFVSKETAFIYAAQTILFLTGRFFLDIHFVRWKNNLYRNAFFVAIAIIVLLTFSGMILFFLRSSFFKILIPYLLISSGIASILALSLLLKGIGRTILMKQTTLAPVVLIITFVLPQMSAIPALLLGWDPLDYRFLWPGWNFAELIQQAPIKTGISFIILSLLSVVIGFWSLGKKWIRYSILFWGLYILLYTSIFTNPEGFFTGVVGSLGYWIDQHSIGRGGQPWFYYPFLQIPIYEFLPAAGIIPALIYGFKKNSLQKEIDLSNDLVGRITYLRQPVFPLLIWWLFSSLIAFSLAGEKMPWLTIHPLLPLVLLAGWGIGRLIENSLSNKVKLTVFIQFTLLLLLGLISIFSFLISNPVSSNHKFWIVVSLLACCFSAWFIWSRRSSHIPWHQGLLVLYLFLLILTIRVSYKANFQNADQGKEYLVYAHGSGSIRDALETIGMVVNRTGSEKEQLSIFFDAGGKTQGVSWPIKWYLRQFPQAQPFYGVDEAILHADIIIADPQSYILLDELTKNAYIQKNYIRMVWPNQDYFTFTFSDIERFLSDSLFRQAVVSIWYKRDYSLYSKLSSVSGFDLHDWVPSDPMRIYVRKSLIQQIWEYGLLSPSIQK